MVSYFCDQCIINLIVSLALFYGLLGIGLTWVISLFSAGILVVSFIHVSLRKIKVTCDVIQPGVSIHFSGGGGGKSKENFKISARKFAI